MSFKWKKRRLFPKHLDGNDSMKRVGITPLNSLYHHLNRNWPKYPSNHRISGVSKIIKPIVDVLFQQIRNRIILRHSNSIITKISRSMDNGSISIVVVYCICNSNLRSELISAETAFFIFIFRLFQQQLFQSSLEFHFKSKLVSKWQCHVTFKI